MRTNLRQCNLGGVYVSFFFTLYRKKEGQNLTRLNVRRKKPLKLMRRLLLQHTERERERREKKSRRRSWLFVFIGCKRDEVILVYFALIKHNGTLSELMSVVLECDKS